MGRPARLLVGLAAVLTLISSSGCTALGGTPGDAAGTHAVGEPETGRLRVSVMALADTAPLHWAIQQNYFRDAGLDVVPTTAKDGGTSVANLIAGQADIAFSSWQPFFVAGQRQADSIKLVANATVLAPRNSMIVTRNPAITKVSDLAGKNVAVSALNTASHLLTESLLSTNQVALKSVHFIEVPFPNVDRALARGDVDAAYLTEPFLTTGLKAGLLPLADTYQDAVRNLPLSGYGTTLAFAQQHPVAITRFQQVMRRATIELSTDRPTTQALTSKITGASQETVALGNYNLFQVGLNAPSLQRAADLAVMFGALGKMDIAPMIWPGA